MYQKVSFHAKVALLKFTLPHTNPGVVSLVLDFFFFLSFFAMKDQTLREGLVRYLYTECWSVGS